MRLIDVDDAINKINDLCVNSNENWIGTDNQSFVDHSEVIDILCDAPTVDAVPVVHASWVDRFGGKYANSHYECSNCKKSAPYKRERDVLGKLQWVQDFADLSYYCPNCGAKMDGGVDDG